MKKKIHDVYQILGTSSQYFFFFFWLNIYCNILQFDQSGMSNESAGFK